MTKMEIRSNDQNIYRRNKNARWTKTNVVNLNMYDKKKILTGMVAQILKGKMFNI